MLEKPDLQDGKIVACLWAHYGLRVAQVDFLPLGADQNTAVYRVVADDGTPYFLKLRRRVFDETAVSVPRFLRDQGIAQIMAPLATRTRQLWTSLDAFHVILYPFVEGRNGYDVALSERNWVDYGAALKGIHAATAPPALRRRLPQETYAPQYREMVRAFLARAGVETFDDPVAAQLAAFLRARREAMLDLVGRAERLALALQARSLELVLCHGDMHLGNLLIDASGGLHIVDWDNAILAPKERDLMFIGGDAGGVWLGGREAALFYRGYGPAQIDPVALAYYRYERIVQDAAAVCEQLFLTDEGGEDREYGLWILTHQFQPHGDVEIAYQTEKTLLASALNPDLPARPGA